MKVCPGCGTTAEQLSKVRLGCPRCYNVFREEILTAIDPVQLSLEHLGKVPERATQQNRLDALKRRMRYASERDDFETAAKLRDEIKVMEHEV